MKYIKIIEWFDKRIPLWERMLEEEYTKKLKGEPYKVICSSDVIPITTFDKNIDTMTIFEKGEDMEIQDLVYSPPNNPKKKRCKSCKSILLVSTGGKKKGMDICEYCGLAEIRGSTIVCNNNLAHSSKKL